MTLPIKDFWFVVRLDRGGSADGGCVLGHYPGCDAAEDKARYWAEREPGNTFVVCSSIWAYRGMTKIEEVPIV